MNKAVRASVAIAGLLAGLLPGTTSLAPRALASGLDDPSCPSSYSFAWRAWTWNRSTNDVYGIQAPVETRFDGLLCTNSGYNGVASGWIGIQTTDNMYIVQAGIIHRLESDGAHWCRFWATGTGAFSHLYDCGDQSDGTYVYFDIFRYEDPTTHQYFYQIEDCGTGGGYGSCTGLDSSQAAFSNPEGVVSAETDYACLIQIMGSADAPQAYGTDSNPVQGLVDDWATRTWSDENKIGGCDDDYIGTQVTGGMVTWDSRN